MTWEIDLSDTGLCVQSIELDVNSKTFESGRVVWQLCGGSACLLPSPGSTLRSDGLAGATKITLTAVVSGGQGDVAWQHAQLFRAHEKEDEGKAQLRIILKLTKA